MKDFLQHLWLLFLYTFVNAGQLDKRPIRQNTRKIKTALSVYRLGLLQALNHATDNVLKIAFAVLLVTLVFIGNFIKLHAEELLSYPITIAMVYGSFEILKMLGGENNAALVSVERLLPLSAGTLVIFYFLQNRMRQ